MKSRTRLALLYTIAFFASLGATLLTLGFYYYTASVWQWDAKLNLSLAAATGGVYTISALLAHRISERFGRRKSLVILYSIVTLLCGTCAILSSHLAIAIALLGYMFVMGMNWPMLESLCSESRDAHVMSRHIGTYNVTWAISGTMALFIAGVIIERWQAGMFILPMLLHGTTALLMLVLFLREPTEAHVDVAHLDPEPELLRKRKLALWLSRIVLPAMYVVSYGLGAIMPLLLTQYPPARQTLYGSIWMIARLMTFAILMATVFWHTRPMLLLAAAIALLFGFLFFTLAPQPLIDARLSMFGGQIVIGVSMGLIYSASLYFGMVLSQGSTEHGGYHEALIGLGGVLGPGAGVLTQLLWPHNLTAAVLAVASVVAISVVAAIVASMVLRSS